jgi:hypothetical protein
MSNGSSSLHLLHSLRVFSGWWEEHHTAHAFLNIFPAIAEVKTLARFDFYVLI